jgi:hypothetical protein
MPQKRSKSCDACTECASLTVLAMVMKMTISAPAQINSDTRSVHDGAAAHPCSLIMHPPEYRCDTVVTKEPAPPLNPHRGATPAAPFIRVDDGNSLTGDTYEKLTFPDCRSEN